MSQSKQNRKKVQNKKPLNKKPLDEIDIFDHDSIYENPLKLTSGLKRLLEEKGLAYRFINVVQLKKNHGYHKARWKPLMLSKEEISSLQQEQINGIDDSGQIIRGDAVLAVKPKEDWERQKAFLAAKAKRYSQVADQKQSKEMKDLAREGRGSVRIHEGYED